MRRMILLALFFCLTAAAQQPVITVPGEPANLGGIKEQLKHYQSCAEPECYVPQLERQADLAIGFLRESVSTAKPGDKLALVLDIDETSLSNWSVELLDDFGYIPADSNMCVKLQCGKAIASTLRIFREAEKQNVTVFFITGRPEEQREGTVANLKLEGYNHWEQLYMRPNDAPKDQSMQIYKSGARAKIVAAGYRIVLNVGDQMTDLNGDPQADHSVKLPNPFYFIP